jgi:hypothetical protein
VGRDWKRYRQTAGQRSATARAAAVARWERYHRAPAEGGSPIRGDPPETLLVITLSGHLCGAQSHRFELRAGCRCGRYRVFLDGGFWREMSLTRLLAAVRRRFHTRSAATSP